MTNLKLHLHSGLGNETFDERVCAHAARIRYGTIRSTIFAKKSLGLSTSTEELAAAQMQATLRTYATAIVLEGYARLPVYDEHPWVATFDSKRELSLTLPNLTASGVRRSITAAYLRRRKQKWQSQIGRNSYMNSRFVILDEFSRTVMIGQLRCEDAQDRRGGTRRFIEWMPPVDSSEIQKLRSEATEYDNRASEEICWDNFSTAEGYSLHAARLRETASCAQYGKLLFP